jgi:hypothetical protein
MARVLVNGVWFEGIASTELYESEFERMVEQDAGLLFPRWRLAPFKVDVDSGFGVRRPDYALIDKKYRQWWVVEIEMAHHSLEGHVLPQVEAFWDGRYGPEHAAYIAARCPDLDEASLVTMMQGEQPRVYVILNAPRPHWRAPLRQFNASLGVVEIFRSDLNRYALRLNGDQPDPPRDALSICRRDSMLPRLLRVDSPAALPFAHGDRVTIEVEGEATEWVRTDTASCVYVGPIRGVPLPRARTLALEQREDGTMVFVART